MAGFLFRKQKQDQNTRTSVVISSPSTLQSGTISPTYPRIVKGNNNGVSSPSRKVSAPKTAINQMRGQRGEKISNGVEGKYGYSTNSLTSFDQGEYRRIQEAARPPQSFARPVSQLVLDKPLPPPADDGPIAYVSPTSPNTPFPRVQQKMLSNPPSYAQKPLPRPSSSQSFLPPRNPLSSSSKGSLPRTRSTSATPSNSSSSVIHSVEAYPNVRRQWSASVSNNRISEDPNLDDSRASMNIGNLTAETSKRESLLPSISADSIRSARRTASQSTFSEHVIDQPEVLSSQVSNEINHIPSPSSSFNARRPIHKRGGSFASGKSVDLVNTLSEGEMTLLPVKPLNTRRNIPSPPSNLMGSNPSSLSRASVVSAYHELYPSHFVMEGERPYSAVDADQRQLPLYRNQTLSRPPPLSVNAPNATPRQSLPVSQRRNQQYLYPDSQGAPTFSDSKPSSLSKATSLNSDVSSVMRGKPRIFSAMEAQESLSKPSHNGSTPNYKPIQVLTTITRRSVVELEEDETPKLQVDALPDIQSNGDVDFPPTSPAPDYNSVPIPPAPNNTVPVPDPQPVRQGHSKKISATHSVSQHEDSRHSTTHTSRTKKLSKVRLADIAIRPSTSNGVTTTLPATSDGGLQKKVHKSQSKKALNKLEPSNQVDEETIRNAGIPLDDDPFARVEGVQMLKPSARHKSSREDLLSIHTDSLEGPVVPPQQEKVSQGRSTGGSHRKTRKEKKGLPASFLLDPALKREPPEPATMPRLLLDPQVLTCLLQFVSFFEWCTLLSLSKEIRSALVRNAALRESALERFLETVGYARWAWDEEPLSLSLQDLNDYMRGVSTPTHEYSRVAAMYIHSLQVPTTHRDPAIRQMVQRFVASTRAYNRVLLRLRAQAEKEASVQALLPRGRGILSSRGGTSSRASSRAPSPVASLYYQPMGNGHNLGSSPQAASSQTNLSFRSPLFKLRRAPLLRVFVPSPEGDWLSDKSVLECEAECKRAGVQHLLRQGDVVWDVAAGDEGNIGRLVWDGTYLIDLDYTYSTMGELPKYLSALVFPPSYFHKVIRSSGSGDPVVHVDLTPWAQEIATNLQLTQDRIRTETSQGAYHNVMHWLHRSSFQLRPLRSQQPGVTNRIYVPDTDNLFVDPGWYGTIVVETEGTNEARADLLDRCGLGSQRYRKPTQEEIENRKVFRILRGKSRPGEIWIRVIGAKERLL